MDTSGIVSIILAVVSIALSLVFFIWSDKSNKEITKTSILISEEIKHLDKLYDKMIDTTFALVKADSDAMRHHIFAAGDTGSLSHSRGDNTSDVMAFLKEGRTKKEIADRLSISEENVMPLLDKLIKENIVVEKNGKYSIIVNNDSSTIDNSPNIN